MRNHAPLTPGFGSIEERIDDGTEINRAWAPTVIPLLVGFRG